MSTLSHVSATCNSEYIPTEADRRESAEYGAIMMLDRLGADEAQTFGEFLADQVRVLRLRDNHPWFEWLADQVERLAGEAEFTHAKDPIQLEDRREVMGRPSLHAVAALESVRLVAGLVAPCLSNELLRAAATLEKAV
jgi:hypothetical protein